MTLEQRIKGYLATQSNGSAKDWRIANALYDGCMNKPNPANGARVANIRKTCHRSNDIIQLDGCTFSLTR